VPPRSAMIAPVLAAAPRRKGDADHEVRTVLVTGHPWHVTLGRSAPDGADRVHVTFTDGLSLAIGGGRRLRSGATISLADDPIVHFAGETPSARMNAESLTLTYRRGRTRLLRVIIRVAVVQLDLLCDANRDGMLDEEPATAGWSWGPDGAGPILLVNNDRDVTRPREGPRRDRRDSRSGGPLDLDDMAPLAVRAVGPRTLPARYALVLQLSDAAAEKIRVFDLSTAIPRAIIEPGASRATIPYARGTRPLRAEGLQYPDVGFTGLITLHLVLTEDGEPISSTSVVFRVAPWIMPSNLQRPRRVFMCEIADGALDNTAALTQVARIATAGGIEFVPVPQQHHRSDRWIQDELEIGYSQVPGKTLGVVLDSPRNRGLDAYPERLIAPDFGWVTRGDDGSVASSLDSFGNLEVSPPVTVGDRDYPLGRIIFGGAHPTAAGRRMMKVVSDFLYAQSVQSPIELYSDWLVVGHVDEFMCFVPADDDLGFRLLLASPAAAWRLLVQARDGGHGRETWLRGKARITGDSAEVTVNEVLRNRDLRTANARYQRFIDWNRGVLTQELGLTPRHIIDIPVLYRPERGGAAAYFPDVVNMLVIDRTVVVPKPFGPDPLGVCLIEDEIRGLLQPLGLDCEFVDTWYSYHILSGEIHCGTNAWREPVPVPWWETRPPGSFDV
jgi:protein-arginine deiminase